MHNLAFYISIILVFLFSCKKEIAPLIIDANCESWYCYHGASALLNNQPWEANRVIYSYDQDSSINIKIENRAWQDNMAWLITSSIHVNALPNQLDSFFLTDPKIQIPEITIYTFEEDGKTITGMFHLLDTNNQQNWISISNNIDSIKTLVGSLQGTFILDDNYKPNATQFKDTIEVQKCRFRALKK